MRGKQLKLLLPSPGVPHRCQHSGQDEGPGVGGEGVLGGSVVGLCQRGALFFPVDIQPPLEESGPQESTAALTMQIPEEPSRVHQPVTRDMGPLEASQKPETEKARNPGK